MRAATTLIPVHQLPGRTSIPTRVEHIIPSDGPVMNGVHRHEFHELFFFAEGSGQHMIDLEQHSIAAPSVHLVAPGQVHRLDRSADMCGSVVMFMTEAQLGSGHAARAELFARAGGPATFRISTEQLAEADALVRSMATELARPEGALAEVVEAYLGILLIKCAHWARTSSGFDPRQEENHDPVKRFGELVERHFVQQRTVAYYAGALALSPGHLNELVRSRTGKSASEVIHERLLLEAKRLLLHANLSVKEISHTLCMSDPAYFNRMFKKATGKTPLAYRTAIREKYKG